ncbi:MAG: hypothetical protein KKB70_05935 [Proteobacteria bacterium]|nr:hypothetical protein [Pseudomonadota bacterium]MBU1611207.1 hypothetical protein [Pseudomonadota bacterium]
MNHYCKDNGCPGHIKNWESCREMRALGGAVQRTDPIRRVWAPAWDTRVSPQQATNDKRLVFAGHSQGA